MEEHSERIIDYRVARLHLVFIDSERSSLVLSLVCFDHSLSNYDISVANYLDNRTIANRVNDSLVNHSVSCSAFCHDSCKLVEDLIMQICEKLEHGVFVITSTNHAVMNISSVAGFLRGIYIISVHLAYLICHDAEAVGDNKVSGKHYVKELSNPLYFDAVSARDGNLRWP